jgi:hypothetical protein
VSFEDRVERIIDRMMPVLGLLGVMALALALVLGIAGGVALSIHAWTLLLS